MEPLFTKAQHDYIESLIRESFRVFAANLPANQPAAERQSVYDRWADSDEPAIVPEKPAPSSPAAEPTVTDRMAAFKPAAERADEGLEAEAATLAVAYYNADLPIGAKMERVSDRRWLRVARAARALRRGGVTEAMRKTILYMADLRRVRTYAEQLSDDEIRAALNDMASLDSGASVVVDREGYYALKKAQQERDALAAKLAEAEKERDARIRELVLVGNERSVTEAHLATARAEAERLRSMSTVEMMGENLNVKHHVEEWEARCLKAEAEAERLRERQSLIEKESAKINLESTRVSEWAKPWAVVEALFLSQGWNRESDPSAVKWLTDRLRTAPPPVSVVDVDAVVAHLMRYHKDGDPDVAEASVRRILRDCTRAVSVEDLAQAVMDVLQGRPGFDVRYMREGETRREQAFSIAREALRALGVREAEKPSPLLTEPLFDIAKPLLSAKWDARDPFAVVLRYATRDAATLARASAESLMEHVRKIDAHTHQIVPAREAEPARGFVVDREKVINAIFYSPEWIDDVRLYPAALAQRAADAAITEYERQRAEHAKGGGA